MLKGLQRRVKDGSLCSLAKGLVMKLQVRFEPLSHGQEVTVKAIVGRVR